MDVTPTNDRRIAVDLREVSFAYENAGRSLSVLESLTLSVHEGEIVSLIGPSGSGKTTILKIIAGLLEPTHGAVRIGSSTQASRVGRCGYVPQGYSLFPWLNVRENIEYGMRFADVPRTQVTAASANLLRVTGLEEFANLYPKALSGGMQQRVAIARALAIDPAIVLMDEPFAALDLQTRAEVQQYFLEVMQQAPRSVVLVTHDIEEAILLSDRILILGSRPSFVTSEIPVKLARPRSRGVRFSDELMAVYAIVAKAVWTGLAAGSGPRDKG